MQKAIGKRIRITRNGKIVRRSMAVDHARTRKSTRNLRNKRNTRGLVGMRTSELKSIT